MAYATERSATAFSGSRRIVVRSVDPGDGRSVVSVGVIAKFDLGRSEDRPCLGENRAQDLLDLVELLLPGDERRCQLDDRVTAVVGTAVEPGVKQRLGKESAQQTLGFVFVERFLRRLVLDHLDPVEVTVTTDIANDRQVVEFLEG